MTSLGPSLYYPCFNIIHGKPFSHHVNAFHVVPLSTILSARPTLPVLIVLNLAIPVTDSGRARIKGAINTAARSTKVCMLIVFGVHMFGLYVNFE